MQKILIATDFSERSDRAVRRGLLLARQYGAAITLVSVVEDDQPSRKSQIERKAVTELLDEQAATIRDVDGVACDFLVQQGTAFDGILQAARKCEADLLVIGPHRRQLLRDVFVGTTAERTIRGSQCPVLMANQPPIGAYRKILLTTDLSAGSQAALTTMLRLGWQNSAATAMLHVYDAPAISLMEQTSPTDFQREHVLITEERRVAAELQNFCAQLGHTPREVLLKPLLNPTARLISETASDTAADLVMIAASGKSRLTQFVLGSVTLETLRISQTDVICIPPEAAR